MTKVLLDTDTTAINTLIDANATLISKVTGAASATDNAITTFDSTTGKLIQDSGLISVDGKIYQEGYPNSYIKFNNGAIEIWIGGNKQIAW